MVDSLRVREVLEGSLVGKDRVHWRRRHGGNDAHELVVDVLRRLRVLHRRLVRRVDLLAVQRVPVDVLEPGVLLQLVKPVVA